MAPDPKRRVEVLREKLTSGERGGSDADRELLLSFSDELRLRREDYGHYRHEKLLRHLVRMSEHSGVELHESILEHADEADEDVFYEAKDVAKAVVRWIHDTYDVEDGSQETNRDYRVAFRLLAKHVTRDDEVPETHAWISTKTTRDYDPQPDEADMLDLEADVKPMLEMSRNPRDKAIIALQFEGGFRGGELYDMRVRDLTDGEHTLKVRADGKRGEHDVHLIFAVPYVNRWLAEHPGDRDDYLWTKLTSPDRLSYQRFLQCFKEPAARAGVEKPVTPTNLRKSNAYWLSTRDKSQAFIEDRQGRSRGSPVISRYVAKFSGETQEKEYASMHGLDVGVDRSKEEVAPVPCPRCGEKTPRDRDFCIHCRQSLDLEVKELLDEVRSVLDERSIEAEDVNERREFITARRTLEEKPHVMDKDGLQEFVTSLSASSSED